MKFKENHSNEGPIIVCKQKNILRHVSFTKRHHRRKRPLTQISRSAIIAVR